MAVGCEVQATAKAGQDDDAVERGVEGDRGRQGVAPEEDPAERQRHRETHQERDQRRPGRLAEVWPLIVRTWATEKKRAPLTMATVSGPRPGPRRWWRTRDRRSPRRSGRSRPPRAGRGQHLTAPAGRRQRVLGRSPDDPRRGRSRAARDQDHRQGRQRPRTGRRPAILAGRAPTIPGPISVQLQRADADHRQADEHDPDRVGQHDRHERSWSSPSGRPGRAASGTVARIVSTSAAAKTRNGDGPR